MANKNFIVKNGLEVGGQEVVSSSGVVTSAALGGQTLASTDSPTFNNLTLTNDIAVGGDLNLTGDLNITGDVNSLSVTDLDVTDQTITLGAGQVESASGGSGIVVDGSGASILWDETNTEWDFNKDINVTGTVTADAVATGASTFTGSLTIDAAAANVTVKDSNDGGTTGYVFSNSSGNTSSIRGQSNGQAIEIKPNEQISALFESGGDISFYEDTGTTAKLFWDASDERLNLTGSDYQFGIKQGSNQPWYNRAVSDGSYRIHLNATGDIITVTSTGIDVTGTVVADNAEIGTGGASNANAFIDLTGDTTYTDFGFRIIRNSGANGNTDLRHRGTGNLNIEAVEAGNIVFETSDTERMRIDSSGDLTFSATTTHSSLGNVLISIPDRAATLYNVGDRGNITIQASGSTSGAQALSGGRVLINAGNSNNGQSGDVIISSGANILNSTDNGKIRFNIGGRTSSEEAMRIDSSGKLQLGTTSSSQTILQFLSATNGANTIHFGDGSSANAYRGYINYNHTNDRMEFATSGSVRMRVSSDGDIRINATDQMGNATLTVKAYTNTNTGLMLQEYDTSNAYGLYTVTTDDSFRITRFVSGSYSDRLIIDSNGAFGINASSFSTEASLFIGKHPSAGNQEGGQLVLQSSANGSKAIHIDNYNNASVDYCRFMRGSDTASEAVLGVWDITNTRFGIGTNNPLQTLTVAGSAWATGYYITALQGNSQLTNASTSSGSNPSYIGQGLISVTVSDAKAKENFGSVETNECLNKIVSLSEHVKKFDWIDEDWKKEKGRTVGMVAQEIYEDHSEFVHKPENYDDDGWAIRYQEIVPTLVKAIQEQQTIIDDLKSRLDSAGL